MPELFRRAGAELVVKVAVSGIVVAFLIFFVTTSPDAATNIFHSGWHSIVNLAHGVGRFINDLAT